MKAMHSHWKGKQRLSQGLTDEGEGPQVIRAQG